MDHHNALVHRISTLITHFHTTKTPFRIYHGSTNSTRPANFDPSKIIDTSPLNHVLSFDHIRKTVLVEPNVPMDALVRATIKENLLPPVVMEFSGITVGGGFVGTAGESSSFKHGFFDRTVNWAEVVLPSGEVVRASNEEHPDLFRGLAGSFGTLGVLTLVELQLEDLKRYVEVRYEVVNGHADAVQKVTAATKDERNDYVDGVLFSGSEGVVNTGRLVEGVPKGGRVQRFSRAWDPWFYTHAQDVLQKQKQTGGPWTEYVPVDDYLFRYDRGAFWMGMYAFMVFSFPFNRFTRWLLNRFMNTRTMYRALHASRHSEITVIQDLAIPISNTEKFLEYCDEKFGIYPLWLCPLRKDARESMGYPKPLTKTLSSGHQDEGYISIGLWGPGKIDLDEFIADNRDLEAKLQELGGLKWLYAKTFYTEEEFWQVYDQEKYYEIREAYGAQNLPSIYDKVKNKPTKKGISTEPGLKGAVKRSVFNSVFLSGLYGVMKSVSGSDYLLGGGSQTAGTEKQKTA
ncbi:FAD binding domain-containing protein [Delitschia confertaspora ATCC 74209]|uniref:Delta(24)-sterol reductase n=1 Tax=Delitschia confertaspora ATCC 74209 TaxID=1513339 RepID=A0A9P4N044_9PLEO|nr:FAD binding domain-containing protein [Delitschia confertaspora ATCC 74209]